MVPDPHTLEGATVVLVHGLYMGPWAMGYLDHGLRAAGLTVVRADYASVGATLPESADRLARYLARVRGDSVHFVAHSLGGLVVRHLFHRYPDQRPGRVVTLGTPHQGSHVARWLAAQPGLGWVLGHSGPAGALGGAPPWNGSHQLGVIAGDVHLGLGQLFPDLPRPNDGTVAVEETGLAGAADRIVLPVTHTGLLLSRQVLGQVLSFLKDGHFVHDLAR